MNARLSSEFPGRSVSGIRRVDTPCAASEEVKGGERAAARANREILAKTGRRLANARLRTLVVDDDPVFLRSIARKLRPQRVTAVSSALSAFDALDRQPFDLILCDVNMPGVRGIGVYEYLVRVLPGTEERLVFVTGQEIRPSTLAYFEGITNLVLRKPLSDSDLARAFERACSAARSRPR